MAEDNRSPFKAFFGVQDDGKVVWIGAPKKPAEVEVEVEALQLHLHSLLRRHGGDVIDENVLHNLTDNLTFLIRHKIGFGVDPLNISILRTDIYNSERGWVSGHRIAVVWYAEGKLLSTIAAAKGKDPKHMLASLKPVVDNLVNDIVYFDERPDYPKVEY